MLVFVANRGCLVGTAIALVAISGGMVSSRAHAALPRTQSPGVAPANEVVAAQGTSAGGEVCGDAIRQGAEECDGGLGCTSCVCDSGFETTTPLSEDCQRTCIDNPAECDDSTDCTADFCDPVGGCMNVAGVASASDGSDGAFNPAVDVMIDLSQAATAAWNTPSPNAGQGVYDPDQWAVVFKYTTIDVPSDVTVRFINHPSGAPVVWLAEGEVSILGNVHLDGEDGEGSGTTPKFAEPGPGGFEGARRGENSVALPPSDGLGPGGGRSDENLACSSGGAYDVPVDNPLCNNLAGGDEYGQPEVRTFIGGSGGGAGTGATNGNGGAGGGAIWIETCESFELGGSITANGGDGGGENGSGGSGGTIRVSCSRIHGDGLLRALGGDGALPSGGDGSDGRIRIDAAVNDLTDPGDPPASESGQDVQFPPNGPRVLTTEINGIDATTDPTAGIRTNDIEINSVNPLNIVVEASGVPEGENVQLRIVPARGNPIELNSPALAAGGIETTAVAVAAFPPGRSELQLRTTWEPAIATGIVFDEAISRALTVCNRGAFSDDDADGVHDCSDACPGFNDQNDADGDGKPDECDECPADPGPVITVQPETVSVCAGDSATLSVTATGSPTLLYQWRKDGVDIFDNGYSGTTTDELTINPTTVADDGVYDVVVSNACGTATSLGAPLHVLSDVICASDPCTSGATCNGGECVGGVLTAPESDVCRIFVDQSVPVAGQGKCWAGAYIDLQDALDDSPIDGCDLTEIWVAGVIKEGYKPDRGTGNRNATFQMKSGVALYGGFSGFNSQTILGGETMLGQRDRLANFTTLNCDINEPYVFQDNCYSTVTGNGTDNTALLDGFFVTGGFSVGASPATASIEGARLDDMRRGTGTVAGWVPNPIYWGGGLFNDDGDLVVRNTVFNFNVAIGGAGVFNNTGNPSLLNCFYGGNVAYIGAGILNNTGSPLITGCFHYLNRARYGCGIIDLSGNATHNCLAFFCR